MLTGRATPMCLRQAIRRWDASAPIVLTLIVGALTGSTAGTADGNITTARLNSPWAVALSADSKKLYIADRLNHAVRLWDTQTGLLTTIAGTSERGEAAICAGAICSLLQCLNTPCKARTNLSRFLLWCPVCLPVVLRLPATTTAGTASSVVNDTAPVAATTAGLNNVAGIALSGDALYVSDLSNSRIRKINLTATPRTIETLVGRAGATASEGALTSVRLDRPEGLWLAGSLLYMAEFGGDRIIQVDLSARTVTWLAGIGLGVSDGPLETALMGNPTAIAVSPVNGDIFIAGVGFLKVACMLCMSAQRPTSRQAANPS